MFRVSLILVVLLLTVLQSYAMDYTVGTTSESVKLHYPISSITVINTHSSNSLFFNDYGGVALNRTASDASTTAGSAVVDLGTDVKALGIKEGDLISMSTTNAGLYSIKSISGDTITLLVNMATTQSGDQSYAIKSREIAPGESLTFKVNTNQFSFKGSASGTTFKVFVSY